MHWYVHVHLHVCAHTCDCVHETYMFVICVDVHVALHVKVQLYHLAYRVKINCRSQKKKKKKSKRKIAFAGYKLCSPFAHSRLHPLFSSVLYNLMLPGLFEEFLLQVPSSTL